MLDRAGIPAAAQRDHLLPVAAAIWACPEQAVRDFPAMSFMRLCADHHMLQFRDRPRWFSVLGGSQVYVRRMAHDIVQAGGRIEVNCPVQDITRLHPGVRLRSAFGTERFDAVVLGVHAPDALAMLADPSDAEGSLLGALRYGESEAFLHEDASFMPRRRHTWSALNVHSNADGATRSVLTYWMNPMQFLPTDRNLFVTLNPDRRPEGVHAQFAYTHPIYDTAALRVQRALGGLQGRGDTWFCGAYFGAGFHEDGLQAGLAVAEALAGVRRPWDVRDESGRITMPG